MVTSSAPAQLPSLHDLSVEAVTARLVADGLRPVHGAALFSALHRDGLGEKERADFSPPLRRWLDENLGRTVRLDAPERTADIRSSDGLTRKFLLRLDDGQTIETVLMGFTGRHTVCLSSQAGCAMGCVFCATGQMGFVRHLRVGEIVAQVLHARDALRAEHGPSASVRNLVVMGMGEPLHNADAVLAALDLLSDTRAANIGPSRITISTVGVVPGITRLAAHPRPYHLAVSLHAANDAARSALVPANRRWPLADILAACLDYHARTGRRIFFEWTLIAGKNDDAHTAHELSELLRDFAPPSQPHRAHINLIPLNPTNGFDGTPTGHHAAIAFQRILQTAGLPSTIRQRRGIDVAAGCGQLRAERGK